MTVRRTANKILTEVSDLVQQAERGDTTDRELIVGALNALADLAEHVAHYEADQEYAERLQRMQWRKP